MRTAVGPATGCGGQTKSHPGDHRRGDRRGRRWHEVFGDESLPCVGGGRLGVPVPAWAGDQLLVTRPEQVEQLELAVSGKDLVVPLDVEKGRGDELGCIFAEASRHLRTRMHVRGLPQAELAQYRAAELITECGAERQAETSAHRETEVAEPRRVHAVERGDGLQTACQSPTIRWTTTSIPSAAISA
jgi:hypothetical protein